VSLSKNCRATLQCQASKSTCKRFSYCMVYANLFCKRFSYCMVYANLFCKRFSCCMVYANLF